MIVPCSTFHVPRSTLYALRCTLLALAILLLLGTMLVWAEGRGPAAGYAVQPGMASGGGYHLTSLVWEVSGTASGGSYRLLGPVQPLQGPGCCCLYLPVLFKKYTQ
ncbi:MAG: hypothetical protein FJZ89_02285 [Chloroflexi bacterium]|nr:hypothetical protein [Chloroflexota bacterium]